MKGKSAFAIPLSEPSPGPDPWLLCTDTRRHRMAIAPVRPGHQASQFSTRNPGTRIEVSIGTKLWIFSKDALTR